MFQEFSVKSLQTLISRVFKQFRNSLLKQNYILDIFLAFCSYSVPLENIIDEQRRDWKWILHPSAGNISQFSAYGLGLKYIQLWGVKYISNLASVRQ